MKRITNIRPGDSPATAGTVIITLEGDETITIDPVNAGVIKQLLLLEELRCGIASVIEDEIASGNIDSAKYEDVRMDFDTEIYDDLADDISCGDYAALCHDGEYIREKVNDLAAYYELEPDNEPD